MRAQQREERNRAAFELASAYTSPPSTAVPKRGGASSWRPMSARSSSSRRCTVGRSAMVSSARSGRGWAEGIVEEPLSLDIDFRRRREGTARRRRMVLDDNNPVNDIEALEDENHKLKVALSRATEENRHYRVNKARLEGELLRADDKIEILLFELEQTPGKRDQRLLHAARSEVEKCAVVRTLAKQKTYLQQLLARQERELDTIKRTKEWSAVMEMTAVTEEYFLEIQRLQKLIVQQHQQQQQQQQQQQTTSPRSCFHNEERNTTREEYTPNRRDQTRRRSSGADSVLWRARPEALDGAMSVANPVRFEQDAQDVETIARSAGDKLRNNHRHTWGAAAVDKLSPTTLHQENDDIVLHDPRASPTGRDRYQRPLSPKRRVSPPRRAQMVSRAGGEKLNISAHGRPRDQHISQRTKQRSCGRWFGGASTVVHRAGGSRSQGMIRAASATTSRRGSDPRTAVTGLRGRRPLSAPRRSGELRTKLIDEERRVGLTSPSSGRAAGGSSGGVGGDGARQPRTVQTPSSSSLRSSNREYDNHAALTVPVVSAEPPHREQAGRGSRRPSVRSHSASPRSGSVTSREKKDRDVDFVPMSDVKVGGHGSAARQANGGGQENGDGRNEVVGRYGRSPANLTAARPPQDDESGPLGAPEIHGRGDESDGEYDTKRGSSSSSRGSLTEAAAAAAETSQTAETAETAAATHTVAPPAPAANKRHHQQAEEKIENSCNGEDGPRDSYSSEQSGAQQGGDESGYQLAGSASSWGVSDEEIMGGKSSENIEAAAATNKERKGVVRTGTSSDCSDVGRWSDAVETTTGENGATKARITVGHNSSRSISIGEQEQLEQEQEEQVIARKADVELSPAASNSGRSVDARSDLAEPGAEFPRSSIDGGATVPLTQVDGDITTNNNTTSNITTSEAYSSSSQAIMEDGLDQGETVGEADRNRLLFDEDGEEENEQLGGESDAAPSQYGDDFDDDFDDEEG